MYVCMDGLGEDDFLFFVTGSLNVFCWTCSVRMETFLFNSLVNQMLMLVVEIDLKLNNDYLRIEFLYFAIRIYE